MVKYFNYLTSYTYKSTKVGHPKQSNIAYKITDLTIRFP